MARQQSLFPLSGKHRGLIGYKRNGNYFVRRMPERVRQTTATRLAAQRFGLASRRGAMVRHAFYSDLDIPCDNGHINRLNKQLIVAAGDEKALTGFRFNHYTGIDRFFTVAPKLFRNGILHIPRQILAVHKDITMLEVKVIAGHFDFNTHQVTGTETTMMLIDPHASFNGADLPLEMSGEGTLVITLQVRGLHKDHPSCNRQYLAADIVAVMAPQTLTTLTRPAHPQHIAITPMVPANNTCTYQTIVQRE